MPTASNRFAGADDFLTGGGIMGKAIRSKNWAATPLGPIETWPQSLRTTVSLCLASNFPINIIWGPNHVQIYNDGYRPLCGRKHPKSLGEDYTKTWASAWESLSEAFDRALKGETSFLENQRMFLDRLGYLEETFFTFSLSPIRDESGEVGGLFHPVTETTAQMLSQRRTRALQDLGSRVGQSKSIAEACELAAAALVPYQLDLPFVLVYLPDEDAKCLRLAASAHFKRGTPASPERVEITSSSAWPFEQALRSGGAYTVSGLSSIFGPLGCGPYPESPETALVLPLVTGTDHPAGFLIAATSPRLPFTDEYRAFIELSAAALTAGIVNARAYEEERRRAERLAELDRAKTVFFSNVSHEFRTPLTLMLGPLEEFLSNPGDEFVVRREAINLVHRNGLRLLRLVNTLLDFSRIEANRIQATYEPTDLATATRDLASTFRSATERAGLKLEVDCDPISEPVYVDREMWEKIIFNLLSNAFKFTFEGAITVRLQERGETVQLTVSDTGTGIPAHEIPKLFKRFHRVQGAKGRTHEGTGIGLALVEDLVKLHGGKVWAESTVGAGSTFFIMIPKGFKHLPREQVSRTFKPDSSHKNTGSAFVEEALRWLPIHSESAPQNSGCSSERSKRILLADDNADMRQYIQNILESEFHVECAGHGLQALQLIEQSLPDLVLTDVMMPELDGFGLLRALRSNRRTQGIPVIMLSARAGEEARVEGIQAGADDYLIKPFSARELRARVRVNLELARLRRDLSREEERERSAAEIERQWRLFDTALSHTPDSIYIFDRNGRLVYANEALLRRWGRGLMDAAGKSLSELGYPPEIDAKLRKQMEHVLQGLGPVRDETTLPDASGKPHHYDYVFVPVFSHTGEIEAVAGSSRDVTGFRETNRALSQANADLQQFAYSASHDLQEPLRMVAVYSQLLKKKYHGHLDSQADLIIQQCVDGAVRMESMIHDLLAYTQASAIPVGPEKAVSLNHVFDSTVATLDIAARESGAIITRGELPALKVEPVHLRQLFQNLLSNALKYRSERPPAIHVAAERRGGEWVFSVADNGIGIAVEYQNQIFGLFKRLHTREQYSGTGLGLAICKKLVEHYHGRIWVESEIGQGSTFFFSLPAEDGDLDTTEVLKGVSQCILQPR
jgi:PAS domain S-box-containing protein